MVEGWNRGTVARVNLAAVRQNVRAEMERLKKGTEIYAVVKADGYGHGAIPVAKAARSAGATGFCVALLDEAFELRQAGITEPILVLGIVKPELAQAAAAADIRLTVSEAKWLAEAAKVLKQAEKPLKIHVKIDTGMGRIGLRNQPEITAFLKMLEFVQPKIEMEGLFTHFATADEGDSSYFAAQQAKFKELRSYFPQEIRHIHTANSATALWHEAWESTIVRLGIAMYGYNPSGTALESPYPLQPALSLETEISYVKEVPKGTHVSYGATYESPTNEWIATLPIGYADGWRRHFSGYSVLVEGQEAPIVGRVCMDQMMIRLPRYFPEGTRVTLIGENNGKRKTMEAAAAYLDTISYEVTCGLNERIPRVYENE